MKRNTLRCFSLAVSVAPLFSMAAAGCVGDSGDTGDGAGEKADPTLPVEEVTTAAPASKLLIPANAIALIPDRYIVKLVERGGGGEEADPQAASGARRILAEDLVSRVGVPGAAISRVYLSALRGFVVDMTEEQALRLAADEDVEYVEQDQVARVSATWGQDRADQRDLPLNNGYAPSYADGGGVHAYIIDTGILATHNEFTGRVGAGTDTVSGDDDPTDCHGHGTHVAGTVGGTTYGVAPGVTLHGVRVLNCGGSGTYSGVIAGVDWVRLNHVSPAVANMSLGGGASQAIDDAVTHAINAGVTFAIAAGNENQDACSRSPARTPGAITVGATTNADARSSFSNWGTCLDIFAPGSDITSAWHTGTSATKTISGTSMAAPHVAGAAARYLSSRTGATSQQVRDALVGAASADKVSDAGAASPNRLLFAGQPMPMEGSIPVGSLGASLDGWIHYTLTVPAGATKVTFTSSGGTGDADLYVRNGAQPTLVDYNCRSYLSSNDETCTFEAPASGTYHVSLYAYAAFSSVALIGDIE